MPTAAQAADDYPVVPQAPGTAITLQGRDAKLLLANDAFAGQQLVYSTSELMTQAQIGSQAEAVLYGPAGTVVQMVRRGRVETNSVEVGLMSGGQVEIRDGLAEGDIVVARAGALLREGDPVRAITAEAEAK